MLKNCLSRKECRIVEDLLVDHAEEIKVGKWSVKSFASYVEGRLKRPVTIGNISGAVKAVDGVQFTATRGQAKSTKSLRQVQAVICLLAKELAQLKGELGMTVSPTLLAISNYSENGESGDKKES
ncbi:hypothetical protein LCGC14_0940120 [marine sediment metagenome]|uniref:Uncharacterized protein n=1 Tax=marine sediment metagenome TaxID=412755 RepID=A0A0F9NQ09_9ZZZZ